MGNRSWAFEQLNMAVEQLRWLLSDDSFTKEKFDKARRECAEWAAIAAALD